MSTKYGLFLAGQELDREETAWQLWLTHQNGAARLDELRAGFASASLGYKPAGARCLKNKGHGETRRSGRLIPSRTREGFFCIRLAQ